MNESIIGSTNKYLLPQISTMLMFFRRSIAVMLSAYLGIPHGRQISCFVAIALLGIWIFKNRKINLYTPHLWLLYMLGLYLISMRLTPNIYVSEYFTIFSMYVFVGGLAITSCKDSEALLKTFCNWSVVLFLLCVPIPFMEGNVSYMSMGEFSSGMAYGEWVLTPAFIGLYLLRKRYGKRYMIILEVVCFILVLIYANRGSLMSVVAFLIVYELFIENKRSRRSIIKWLILSALTIVVYFQLENILLLIQSQILSPLGISSRSISNYIQILSSETLDMSVISVGRVNTSSAAGEFFKSNPFFGIGIGTFRVETGHAYTHNFITDAITTFGLIGGFPILFIAVKACIKSFIEKNLTCRLLLLVFLVQTFPRLLFSQSFVIDVTFWMFILLALCGKMMFGNSNKGQGNYDKENKIYLAK